MNTNRHCSGLSLEVRAADKVTLIATQGNRGFDELAVMEVLDVADRVYSIKLGQVALSGCSDDLKEDKEELKDLFL